MKNLVLAALAATSLLALAPAASAQPWGDVDTRNVLGVDLSAKGPHYEGGVNSWGPVNTTLVTKISTPDGLSNHDLYVKNLRDSGYDPKLDFCGGVICQQ